MPMAGSSTILNGARPRRRGHWPATSRSGAPSGTYAWAIAPCGYGCRTAPADGSGKITGTLHLQVAPWTKTATIKLICSDPVSIATVAVQIEVRTDPLDIAIDRRYGSDYQVHFNLPEPRKGYMMHCLTALYPWFKATYEEGGIPGILWEDYQCDGFATETQKREMRIFRERLDAALSSPEALRARAAGAREPSRQWRKGTRPMWSYRMDGPTAGSAGR
jgi:hypothetical protein